MARPAIGTIAKVGVLWVVISAAVFAGAVAAPRGTTSSTQSTTASSAPPLYTASASGPIGIEVTRTTVDQTTADSPSGNTVFIYDVTLTGNDSASQPSNASYFTLTGSGGTVYDMANASAMTAPLPSEALSSGQQASGQVAFQVPNSDKPAKLAYDNPADGVDVTVANLPAASRWVSSVAGVSANLASNSATSNYFVTAVIQNSTKGLFYSTGTIPVKLEITPYNYDDIVGQAVPDITVTSITATTLGFSVASISPHLPVTVSANGNLAEVDIVVDVSPPSVSVNVQTLELSIVTT
jgi:hypothetical protein